MRKIILFILCVFCTTVFGQDMVRPLYPNTTVSPNHHMTFLGVSMGRSISSFQAGMKQKGLKYIGNDAYGYHYKGNIFGLQNFPVSIWLLDSRKITTLYSYKEFHEKNNAESYFKKIENGLNKIYLYKTTLERNNYGDKYKEKYKYWDIFSQDKKNVIGTIVLSIIKHYNVYSIELRIEDVLNNNIALVQKRYDLTQYVKPTYSKAYLDVFPKYSNLVMYNFDGTSEVYNIQSPEDFTKFIYSDKYNEFEKKFIFYEYAKEVKKMNISKTSSLYNLETIYNLRLDYDRAKAQYLASHPQKNNGYGIANFFFDSVMGKDLVNFYKSSGQYDYFIDCLKKGSRKGSSSSSSTNWDGLSDSQKAVIHEHDNAR